MGNGHLRGSGCWRDTFAATCTNQRPHHHASLHALIERKPARVVTIAIANKIARTA
jgi:hypothetical protein